jgi:3-phosphoshikimate 1-carboxyvinyltransferase
VSSVQKENGVEISSSGTISFPSTVGFKNNPDLAQMFAFLAATLGEKLELTGLDNLRIKETNRIAALKTELEKLGVSVIVDGNSMTVSGKVSVPKSQISTYNDHRMAMSATVLSSIIPTEIMNPEVVGKSYPGFWSALEA